MWGIASECYKASLNNTHVCKFGAVLCCETVIGESCVPDTCQMVLFLTVGSHGAELCMGTWQSCTYCRNHPHFMEPDGSLPRSQEASVCFFSSNFRLKILYAFVFSDLSMWHEQPITSSYTRLSCRPVTVLFGPPSCLSVPLRAGYGP